MKPCGCKIDGINDRIGWHLEIKWCSLHASAERMKEFIEKFNKQELFNEWTMMELKKEALALLKELEK